MLLRFLNSLTTLIHFDTLNDFKHFYCLYTHCQLFAFYKWKDPPYFPPSFGLCQNLFKYTS